MSDTTCANLDPVTARLSWRALRRVLEGDALAAFPSEAFAAEAVALRILGHRQFILNRPEAIRRVLVENPAGYARPAPTLRVLRPIFGRGLFLAEGEEWAEQRHVMAAAFTPRAVRILARHVALGIDRFVADLAARSGEPVDLVPLLRRLALEIIGRALFSLEMERWQDELYGLISAYAARLGRPAIGDFLFPGAWPSPRDFARARFRRDWRRLIGRIVAERLDRCGAGEPSDLFDLLASSHPAGAIDADRLADQVSTILVAGHDTTSAALFWSLYLLATLPQEQWRVAEEAAAAELEAETAADELPRLVYTRAFVEEVLRLYPPAFVIVRRARRGDIADGLVIPKGSLVLISPFVLHRHGRLWREPGRFDPSRFLPDAPPPPRFSYLPFGAGPRVCIGAQFALTELVLATALLARAFRIALPPGMTTRPKAIVTTQPETPPPFLLEPRGAYPDGRAFLYPALSSLLQT
ncbi:MAG TPA: cytochrome P450 [Stellaceae bacterium]|nr:cytochrome P450 [Stellaceae bacterium]